MIRRTNRSNIYDEYYESCNGNIDAKHAIYQPGDTNYYTAFLKKESIELLPKLSLT